MRILITSTGAWGTGSFTVIDALVKEFLQFGHQVKVFFPDNGLQTEDAAQYYDNPDVYTIWSFPLEQNHVRIETFPLMIPDPNPRSPSHTFEELSEQQLELYLNSF